MNRTTQKKEKLGYALRIYRNETWEKVGYVFKSKHEAVEFKTKRYPDVSRYTIMGIRLDVTPVAGRREETGGRNEAK